MIISTWKGYEIDSSEGYYAFENKIDTLEEGWNFLEKLLTSQLLWSRISFALVPGDKFKQQVEGYLQDKFDQGIIKKFEYEDEIDEAEAKAFQKDYDYTDMADGHLPSHIDPDYETTPAFFLYILQHLKKFLLLASVNFCVNPFSRLSEAELKKFHSWFLDQFRNKKKAENRWMQYSEIKENHFKLRGNCEADYSWDTPSAFEANFEMYSGHPPSFRINVPAVDPSLVVYLVSTLIHEFEFVLRGRSQLMNEKPGKLKLRKRGDSNR